MKKTTIFILVIVGIVAAFAGTIIMPATVSAYESRPTYSLQEISEGALGDTITFNSIKISDSDYAWHKEVNGTEIAPGILLNETNFVGARKDTGINAGADNVWQGTEITAEDGETYLVRLYAHNNNPLGEKAIAEDVKVCFYVPYASDTSVIVNGWLTAANATPNEYFDNVIFTSADGNPFHLEYVYGSAFLENNGIAASGLSLSDNIVNRTNPNDNQDNWVFIGYDALDGKIPGCYQYANYVGIKVKVVYDYAFTTETKVRLAGDTDKTWKDSVEAKVGDIVEFQLTYCNTSDYTQSQVVIRNVLPSNLHYITGSTKLKNSTYPNGTSLVEDYLVEDGIRIGSYAQNSKAYVTFTAEIIDEDLAEGSNTLVNWGRATVSQKVLQDYACVILYKDTKFQITFTVLLSVTIVLLIIIAILLYKMIKNTHHRE